MRQTINSDKRTRFVELCGQGLDEYEAFQLSGFSTAGSEAGWKANARSLVSKLRSEIDAARAANNLPGSRKSQVGELSDEESAELLAQTREALKAAQAQSNVGATTKLLRQLERLTRKSARGRPPNAAPQKPEEKSLPPLSPGEFERLVSLLLTEEEEAEIAERYPAHVETERQLWLQGMPNRYWEVAYGRKLPKPEEEPSLRTELNTSVSVAAIETVRRL